MEMTFASVLIVIVLLIAFRKPIKGIFNFINTIAEPTTLASAELIKSNCGKQLLKAVKQNHATVEEAAKNKGKTMTGDEMLKALGYTISTN